MRPEKAFVEKKFMSDSMLFELGQKLCEKQLLSRSQLDELNARCALTGDQLDKLILKESVVGEQEVLKALSELSGIPFEHMGNISISKNAVEKVPPKLALQYNAMPVALDNGTIVLAVSSVPNATVVDSIRILLDSAIDWKLCTCSDISKSIKHFYGLGANTIDQLDETREVETEIHSADISLETAEEGIIKFVNQIILEAIQMDATDIHIEPYESNLRLRYRIDGILQTIPLPDKVRGFRKAIASCVKIMADLNIAEKRLPHDGRIKVRVGDDDFDLRVSILPSRFGETVNMRILSRKTAFIDLEHLGLKKSQAPQIEYFGSMPHGVVLLTGPTGSGKTTTLYALLSKVNNSEKKTITVEDPVEYQIEGINQIQVHSQIGLTFASILRSILRHDPDIILIGEIRDMETADIAVRASLTGHLVFSTLHTNDAPSAIARLVDMGVEPYLVASCLEGVIAQRLVRQICTSCKEEVTPDGSIIEEIAAVFPEKSKGAVFYKGHGCPECNFTGYRGRKALFEIMALDDDLRQMVTHLKASNEIKKRAMEKGLITLRKDGWSRVLDGTTSVEEIARVTRRDEFPSIITE